MSKPVQNEGHVPGITRDPVHIGQALRARRTELELSIADIAELTKIRPEFLGAIEEFDMEALPSMGYVLGYVRSYAKALGMDSEKVLAAFKTDAAIPKTLGVEHKKRYLSKRKRKLPRGIIPALGVVGIAVMITAWYGVQTETLATNLQNTPFDPAVQIIEPKQTIEDSLVTIRATAPSWVQVKDPKGTTLVSRIFITGEMWQGPRQAGYTVSFRDASAIEIFIGETKLPALGAQGEALYDVELGQ